MRTSWRYSAGKGHRLFSDILGTLTGGLGLAFECVDGIVRGRQEAIKRMLGLLDALLGKRTHFGGNFQTIVDGHAQPPAVTVMRTQ
jgi:hypothetical protein